MSSRPDQFADYPKDTEDGIYLAATVADDSNSRCTKGSEPSISHELSKTFKTNLCGWCYDNLFTEGRGL